MSVQTPAERYRELRHKENQGDLYPDEWEELKAMRQLIPLQDRIDFMLNKPDLLQASHVYTAAMEKYRG